MQAQIGVVMLNLDLSMLDASKELDINLLKRIFEKIENYSKIPNLENFKFYEVTETAAVTKAINHNLGFVPVDSIVLSNNPSTSTITILPQTATTTALQYTTSAAGTFRFLIGRY